MKIQMKRTVRLAGIMGQYYRNMTYELGQSMVKQLPKNSYRVLDVAGKPLKERSDKNKKAEPKNNSGDGKLDPLPEAKLKEIQRLVTKRGQVGYAYQNGKGKWQHCYNAEKLAPGTYHTVEPEKKA